HAASTQAVVRTFLTHSPVGIGQCRSDKHLVRPGPHDPDDRSFLFQSRAPWSGWVGDLRPDEAAFLVRRIEVRLVLRLSASAQRVGGLELVLLTVGAFERNAAFDAIRTGPPDT